ncbi:MAG: Fe-S cluster assembly protein SufD [Candidatus Hinthialibacter antarcticus]|nr:Fe-S cluster assembly protein SufD [Candidatus Hinthialibacter antarcticus]
MCAQSTTELQEAKAPYKAAFEALSKNITGQEPSWLSEIRKEAFSRFDELGFPTTRQEEWRFTNVRALAAQEFSIAEEAASYPKDAFLAASVPAQDAYRLVFVNGLFSTELSDLADIPANIKVGSLASALLSDPAAVEPHLARLGSYEANPFAALNTAMMRDGAVVFVPQGVILDKPVHLIYLSNASEGAVVSYPRTLVIAGNNSQFNVIESFAGIGETYFTNAVTEIVAGENVNVHLVRLQREEETAYHISTTKALLAKDAVVKHHNICYGAALTRNSIDAVLDAEGIDCTLNGLVLARGKQHVDNQTTLFHEKPHCHSWEMYKSILDGESQSIFKGKIFVQQDAQKTDAKQNSQGLLLSDKASVHSMPQLEIYADDVKCTHGATTGRLNEQAIFYAQTRGISKPQARAMLTYAYAKEVVDEIPLEAVREELDALISSRLPV